MSGGASRQGGPTTVFQPQVKCSRPTRERSRAPRYPTEPMDLPVSVDSLSILRQALTHELL